MNDDLTWYEVGNISTGPGTMVQDAFQQKFGTPTKEYLHAGMSLYKFNGFPTLARGVVNDSTPLSPWWSPTKPFKHDGGLEQRCSIAKLNGISLREWGRLTSVIKENWSSLDWLLKITLKVPVYAWFGGFKGMPRIDAGARSLRKFELEARGRSSGLPGGGTQFYIPNLMVGHIETHIFSPL